MLLTHPKLSLSQEAVAIKVIKLVWIFWEVTGEEYKAQEFLET
jgi:hypothetical protein